MLKIEHLSKSYNKHFALENIDFLIPEKSITGIIGPKGAGKSALLRVLTGFDSFDSGRIVYNNNEVYFFRKMKEYFSYMPDNISLYPDYSVAEFTDFIHGAAGCERIDILDSLQLSDIKDKKIKYLTTDYHQKLKLYTALCTSKKLILLDESFASLNPIQILEVIDLIKSENSKGTTFIITTDQINYAERVCSYFILLNHGRSIAVGNINELSEEFEVYNNNLEDVFIKALLR